MSWIDGTHLKEHLTCPRLPWLRLHPPAGGEGPAGERLRILMRSGRRIERRILAGIDHATVNFPDGDLEAGAAATRTLLERRVPALAGAVLLDRHLVGRPDLLLWNKEDQRYEVAEIKSSQRMHASTHIQVAFYSRLLARLQQPPSRGWAIARDGLRTPVEVAALQASIDHLLAHLEALRHPRDDPRPHRIVACDDCRFRQPCAADLAAGDDLGRIPRLTRAQAAALRAAGAATVEALAFADRPAALAERSGLPHDLLRRLRTRARAVTEDRPVPFAPFSGGRAGEPLSAATIALAALYDQRQIEPAVAIAGLVLGQPAKTRVRFLRPAEATDPAGERDQMLDNLCRSRGPIVVYGPDVDRALETACDGHPHAGRRLDELRPRLYDLRAALRRALALPGFDHTPAQAARAARLDVAGDDAVEIEALRYLEGEEGAERAAIGRLLGRDLGAIAALLRLVLEHA